MLNIFPNKKIVILLYLVAYTSQSTSGENVQRKQSYFLSNTGSTGLSGVEYVPANPSNRNSSPGFVIFLNGLVDAILNVYQFLIYITNSDQIPLPDIDQTLPLAGYFRARGGIFTNIASLERTDDATISINGSSTTLSVSLGFQTLQATYTNYSLGVSLVVTHGQLKFVVGENSLIFKLVLQYLPNCSIRIEALEIETLQDLDLTLTGLGIFTYGYEFISNTLLRIVESRLRNMINGALHDYIIESVNRAHLCNIIPTPNSIPFLK